MPQPTLRYFDCAAAMPSFPEALEAFTRSVQEHWANPSSLHRAAQQAEASLMQSRETLAQLFGCRPSEVVLTASGTESDNLAIRGVLQGFDKSKRHLLTTAVEHPAVAATLASLAQKEGFQVETIPVDVEGKITPQAVADRIRPDTALVSVIWGNNELGTLNPVAEIAAVCREHGVLFHTDAVQATAWLPFSFSQLGASLVSVGGRKLGSPGGGVLLVRQGVSLSPIVTGGPQEEGRRAGTPDVAQAAALAKAATLARQRQQSETERVRRLRDRILHEIPMRIERCQATGSLSERLPNHASFVVDDVEGNALCRQLDLAGFACAPGAACKTGRPGPSSTLLALGFSESQARCGLRISLGWATEEADVDALLEALPPLVQRLRRGKAEAPES